MGSGAAAGRSLGRQTYSAGRRRRADGMISDGTRYTLYSAMMGFGRASAGLCCDGVPLSAIAEAAGTPVYVYSAGMLRARYRAIDRSFGDYPHALHYALKANSTLALARLMRELGSAVDANSIWEIELAVKAGFRPADIVFTGVGKSAADLECAVSLGLKAINVESAGELARIEAIAARTGRVAPRCHSRQPRHRREEPSAHFDRPQDQQVRRTDRRGARAVCHDRPPSCAPARGRSCARRLADHHARSVAPRGGARGAVGRGAGARRCGARVYRPGGRLGHFVRRQRRAVG